MKSGIEALQGFSLSEYSPVEPVDVLFSLFQIIFNDLLADSGYIFLQIFPYLGDDSINPIRRKLLNQNKTCFFMLREWTCQKEGYKKLLVVPNINMALDPDCKMPIKNRIFLQELSMDRDDLLQVLVG